MQPWQPRPYHYDDLSTKRFEALPASRVTYAQLTPTQRGVWIGALLSEPHDYRLPYIVAFDGQLFIEDGHTRICRAVCRGIPSGYAKVLRIGEAND